MPAQILKDVAAIEAKGLNNITPSDFEDLVNQCKLLVIQREHMRKEIQEYRMTLREIQPFIDHNLQNTIRSVLK